MVILPSIDLKDCKCVKLYKGDFKTVHGWRRIPFRLPKNLPGPELNYPHRGSGRGIKRPEKERAYNQTAGRNERPQTGDGRWHKVNEGS